MKALKGAARTGATASTATAAGAGAGAAASKPVLIPGVRVVATLSDHQGPAAADGEDDDADGSGDETATGCDAAKRRRSSSTPYYDDDYLPLHQPHEIDERWANAGCVWFRCQCCSKLRRLTDKAGQQGQGGPPSAPPVHRSG